MGSMEDKRVLVVDDDAAIRGLLCTVVKREQVAVDYAADGAAAIKMLQQRSYSLVLLDLMMPRLDGFGVIDFLKQNPIEPKPVVLVLSAYEDQKLKDIDSEIVAGVMRKPFEVADIGRLVHACVSGPRSDVARLLQLSRDRALQSFPNESFLSPPDDESFRDH